MKKFAIALTLLLSASAVWAEKRVEETRPADPDARISIENLSGSVRISGWDRSEIKIEGSLGDDTEGLTIRGGESSWQIEVEFPDARWGSRRDIESHLEIRVPRGAALEVETVSASIRVREVEGRLDLETVSGEIDAVGGGGTVELETVSGSIELTGGGVDVTAESVSGSIRVREASGGLEVSSVSGRVDVEASIDRRAVFESVSGELTLALELSGKPSVDIDAHSSNVNLTLARDVSARFEVATFSGRIDNEFGPDGERTSRFAPGRSLDYTVGQGAARISIETFSGNVSLRRR